MFQTLPITERQSYAVAAAARSEEEVELYVMGRLPSPDGARVEAHLIHCRDCCLRVVRDERFMELLRGALRYESETKNPPALHSADQVLAVMRMPTRDGRDDVLIALRQDAFVELQGDPWPGLV